MLKQFILKLSLLLSCFLLPFPALAQKIDGITVFGDSLSSTSYVSSGGSIPPPSPPYFDGRFSNGPVWVEGFSTKFQLPPTAINNYAVGGSTSRRGNAQLPGLRLQLNEFLRASPTVSPERLVIIWSGANDYPTGNPATVVGNISTAVQRLVNAGAQQLIVPNLPERIVAGSPNPVTSDEVKRLTAEHNRTLRTSLQTLAQTNPKLSIVPTDVAALFDAVAANPARFGFNNVDRPCLDPMTGDVCATPDTYLFWDEAPHPTAAGHRLIAAYALDSLTASSAIAAQAEVALGHASRQTRQIDGRLQALRSTPPPQAENRKIGVFVDADANFGDRSTTTTNAGYKIDTKGVTVGADYPVTEHLAIGLAVSSVRSSNPLNDNRGKVAVDSTSIAVYGSYTHDKFYTDALLDYGWDDLKFARNIQVPGFSPANASTKGNQLSLRVSGGYEFDFHGLAVKPNAGIRYSKVNINGYTEQDGDLLNLQVNPQAADSVVVNLGAQISYPFQTAFGTVSPYFGANYERELAQNDRQIVTELVTQPGIPMRTTIPAADRDFIRLSTGLQTEFTNNLSVTLGYETILGKDNFRDNYVNAKVRYQF